MSDNRPIGIFDSGVGGLTVAQAIADLMPNESIRYIGDTARMPYGDKSPAEIAGFCLEMAGFLVDHPCKAIVIACHTASAYGLETVRAHWPTIPVIAMEPAIKPAAENSRSGVIGVMATQGTLRSQRYGNLKNRFGKEVSIVENPCDGLAHRIESGQWDTKETRELIKKIILPMTKAGADHIVLGCTHYPIIIPLLYSLTSSKDISLINPAPAIARQLQRRLVEKNLCRKNKTGPEHHVWATGPMEGFHYLLPELLPNSTLHSF